VEEVTGVLDPIYRRFPALLMARRNIGRTKIRSILAALGIVIGVIAIASLGMFGLTLRYNIQQNLGDIGNQVQVSPASDDSGRLATFSERDIRDIERVAGPDATVVPQKQRFIPVALDRGEPENRIVRGIARPSEIYEARSGSIPDPYRSGALVGATLAEENDLEPGSTITVDGSTVRVLAVLEASQGLGFSNVGDSVILPANRLGDRGWDQVTITTESSTRANQTAVALREELNDRRERVEVQDFSDIADSIGQTFQTLNLFLIGIGSISLLVAGISILNVMLMSTVERREEIGVMRAVGFQKMDVLKIMLSEATLLGFVGGVFGIVFSVAAGMIINHVITGTVTTAFRPQNFVYIGLAFAFGVGTALLSGFYPAWKAANERPVDALRG
jgi:putative ABC transport system permease protein